MAFLLCFMSALKIGVIPLLVSSHFAVDFPSESLSGSPRINASNASFGYSSSPPRSEIPVAKAKEALDCIRSEDYAIETSETSPSSSEKEEGKKNDNFKRIADRDNQPNSRNQNWK